MNKSKYELLRAMREDEIQGRIERLDTDAQHHEGLAEKANETKKTHTSAGEGCVTSLRKLVRQRASGKAVYLLRDGDTTNEAPDGQEELFPPSDERPDATKNRAEKGEPIEVKALPAGNPLQADDGIVYRLEWAGRMHAVAQERVGGPWYVTLDGSRDTQEFATSGAAMEYVRKLLGSTAKKPLTWKRTGPDGKPLRPGQMPKRPAAPKAKGSKGKGGKKPTPPKAKGKPKRARGAAGGSEPPAGEGPRPDSPDGT